MDKTGSSADGNRSWLKRLGKALVSRKACYVYIIAAGVVGGSVFGMFVKVDQEWISVVFGLLIFFFFFQLEQVFYLSKQIEDMHPKSSPTREIIDEQSKNFRNFTRDAITSIENRLVTMVKTLPGLFTLATDPAFQQSLLRIGETVRAHGQAVGILNKIVAISLEKAASDVDAVATTKLIIRNQPEVADARWKAALEPTGGGQYAVATSWVLPEWWHLNQEWRGANEAAIQKGLRLARIFIVENEKELDANKPVMREQAKQGIQVNWVYASCLRRNELAPRDILISNCIIPDFDNPDNSAKQLKNGSIYGEQVFEPESEADATKTAGYRMSAKMVELSAYPPEVAIARTVIQGIYQLSERFDDSEWWSYFFDDDYTPITRYKENTAEHETNIFIKATKLKAGSHILDLGCAYGRIEQVLQEKVGAIEVIPVECSEKLLNQATSSAIDVFTRRGAQPLDMRNIDKCYKEQFDVVMSTFTSWGYFREADNYEMFKKVIAVLKPGGLFYLDIDNPSFIRANTKLVEYQSDSHTVHRWDAVKESMEEDCGGRKVKVARRLSQFSIVKPDGSIKSKPLVSLRLYELNELQTIASRVGLEFLQAWDEKGEEWRSGRALRAEHIPERIIVVLKKPEH